MRRRTTLLGLAAVCILTLLPGAAAAAPGAAADPDLGHESIGWAIARSGNGNGATPCAVCHGMDGSGRPASGVPRLAGQDPTYLTKQLKDFQLGARGHFTMEPVARTLSEADIQAVVSYYAGLPPNDVTPSSARTEVLALGKWIAERGIAEKGVASCNSCHGADGGGVAPLFPRLRGQAASYMRNQFERMRTGERHNDPAGMMRAIAAQLSMAEVRAAAAYYESLGTQQVVAAGGRALP